MCYPETMNIAKRKAELIALEMTQPEQMVYLSFADIDGWKGGAFTLAHGMMTAVMKAHQLGFNPGGQVQGYHYEEEVPLEFTDRLLNMPELQSVVGEVVSVRTGKTV